ncbi:hypothetical protein D9M68_600460 [compost metagenome]
MEKVCSPTSNQGLMFSRGRDVVNRLKQPFANLPAQLLQPWRNSRRRGLSVDLAPAAATTLIRQYELPLHESPCAWQNRMADVFQPPHVVHEQLRQVNLQLDSQ